MQVVERSSVLALSLALAMIAAAKWIGFRAEDQRCLSAVRSVPGFPADAAWTVARGPDGVTVARVADYAIACSDDSIPLLTPMTEAARTVMPGRAPAKAASEGGPAR